MPQKSAPHWLDPPHGGHAVVDLDIKNRERLIKCIEGGHYFETTPSGVLHVFVGSMTTWSRGRTRRTKAQLFCNWAFEGDADQTLGEVLCQGGSAHGAYMRGDGNSYAAGPEGLSNDKGACVAELWQSGIVPIASNPSATNRPQRMVFWRLSLLLHLQAPTSHT